MATTTFVSIVVTMSCLVINSIGAHNIVPIQSGTVLQRNPDDECPRTTEQKLLSHESDCSLFYICLNGRAVLQKCPHGLHFNLRTSVCDFPRNAGCETETATARPRGRIGGGGISDVQCPSFNGRETVLVPHATECGQYFMCDNGVPHLRSCQSGLHFNPSVQACDYPDSAGCETSVTKSPREQVGGDNSEIQCPAKNGLLPVLKSDPKDCSRFYICDNGKAHSKECQAGLYFNPKVNACDYPANVPCDSDVNSKNDRGRKGKLTDVDSLISCPTVRSEETVLISNPLDCSKFFMCHRGQPHPRTCPSGLHFNRFSQECDYPTKAQCSNDFGPMFSVGVPSPFCPTVSGKIPIFYGHPTNCSIYYLCSNGLAYEFVCPARLHFNQRQKVCDYETNARCPAGKKSDP